MKFLLEGGAELVAVLADDGINERDSLGASANRAFGPSGATRPARLELVRGAWVHSVFKPLENGDWALSKAACSAARMRARSSLRNLWGVSGRMNWRA